jgi:hypothetical protein
MNKTMRFVSIFIIALVPICMCSCTTVMPETNADYQIISTLIHANVQNDGNKVEGPIRIEIKETKVSAYYTVKYRIAQQPWNPMMSTLVKQDGAWVLKESKSIKPWYYCFK